MSWLADGLLVLLQPVAAPPPASAAKMKFGFTTPISENGYCGYSEIALFGMPAPVLAANPPNITVQVTSNGLKLSSPTDHTGWRLQVQNNGMAQGLRTNGVDVPGATATNEMTISISAASGGIFYRMAN
jgi:hypothetical protein